MRINKLSGAVVLAQLRKLDLILNLLYEKKKKLKETIQVHIYKYVIDNIQEVYFRRINDEGECATPLTLPFKDKQKADLFAKKIGTKAITHSGWHVYSDMEQILGKKTANHYKCPYIYEAYGKEIDYSAHMLPVTDDIFERAVNISVGVVDNGLGAPFGININSTDDGIAEVTSQIRQALE